MSARVNIEADAWSDQRFATLARLCKLLDSDVALIKCARIWSWQTENYTPEEPTYVVDRDLIEGALGDGGADAMVRARLAEEVPEGFRIKGSVGRIEWLYRLRMNGAKHQRGARQAPAQQVLGSRKAAHNEVAPAQQMPSTSKAPARAHADPLSSSLLDQDQQNSLSRQRARDPWAPGREYDPHSPAHVTALLSLTYTRVASARLLIAAELALPAPLPLPPHDTPSQPVGVRDLRERIRGEGAIAPMACGAVVESAIADARATKSVDWLSEKLFTEGGWRTARNRVPGWRDARAGPRGAIGAATPRTDHPTSTEPIPIRELLESKGP